MTTGCADVLLELPRTATEATPRAADNIDRAAINARGGFGVGPVRIELRSDLSDVVEDLAVLYRGCRHTAAAADRVIRMEVRAAARTRWGVKRYAILGDGKEIFGGLRPEEVLPYLEWGINHRVIATCSEYLQLHAATLAHAGGGVMLVGESGCGKSTLTVGLAARGWGYLSDEFALIAPDTLHVHPFPKALCIKAGSFDVVRRLGLPLWRRRPYVKALKGKVGYVSPLDVNAETSAFPIRLIVFPRYTGVGRTALYPISRGRAAFSLAANAFNRHLFGDRLVPLLAEVVRNAACVALEPGGMDETCDLLESLVSSQRARD